MHKGKIVFVMKDKKWRFIVAFLFTAAFIIPCACKTTPSDPPSEKEEVRIRTASKPSFKTVSFSAPTVPVGDMIRRFGESNKGGIVLMSGLEERAAGAVEFAKKSYEDAVANFAASINCTYLYTPHYYFILPTGYEQLLEVRLDMGMHEAFHSLRATVAFGSKTPVYTVCTVLSQSLDTTIVTDNHLAEAIVGEYFLTDVPLSVILEAMLQSARVPPDAFIVESTPEYLFLRSSHNPHPASSLLNDSSDSIANASILKRTVSLTLPGNSASVDANAFIASSIPLKEALTPLTEQLGIEVAAHRKLADIPIMPCVMNNISLETALNLLLWQWPVHHFGYEIQPNRVLLRER